MSVHKVENIEDTWHGPAHDSRNLMKQIAKMANIEACGINRMILVLDARDAPRLYTQCMLDKVNANVELHPVPIVAEERNYPVDFMTLPNQKLAEDAQEQAEQDAKDKECGRINTTTDKNKEWETFAPLDGDVK